ncbi:BMP family lipoprotein [Halocatena pleomorpha]|uniref:BMP family ABC transporter substrate-binding protein n=1 Tax=Halocatena pleomorpha TaxID=1785090 RepID=A0A3P3RF47_9EURY|nr:BMP family protein [Halocatena pleomorpha]RRJ31043.1 BMP family ABC transporter substrate-binding protein [Halocatena pleomorpha]
MDRRTFVRTLGVTSIAGLAGCTGGPTDNGGNTESTDGGAASVAVVYATGGLGDGSFNDQAQTGLERAKKELSIKTEHSQPSNTSEFSRFQSRYAQSTSPDYDLVCCIGSLQQDPLSDTAPEFPEQRFMLIDGKVDEPNVENYQFREEEGSFQVGHLAGLLTKSGLSTGAASTTDATSVGFIGGKENPLIKKFEAGFKAGVAHTDDAINVTSNYVGSFNDVTSGKEAALTQYSNGVDIIYHAAGNTGTGVFQAAQEAGRYAIGVDSDQSKTESKYADHILASMVKYVNIAMFNAIKGVVEDAFEGGTATTLGLKQEGVKTVYGKTLGSEIPAETKSKLESSKEKIVSGKISVPTDPSNV